MSDQSRASLDVACLLKEAARPRRRLRQEPLSEEQLEQALRQAMSIRAAREEKRLARAARVAREADKRRRREELWQPTRELLGLRTIREVARAAHLTPCTLSHLLSGEQDPRIIRVMTLEQVATALHVSLDRLYEWLAEARQRRTATGTERWPYFSSGRAALTRSGKTRPEGLGGEHA